MLEPLSADILLSQKSCCGNGCTNCPYVDEKGKKHRKGSISIAGAWQKWVLFDFDGTLANSMSLQKDALQELSRQHGWPELTESDFAALRQMSLKDALKVRKIPLWRVPFLAREATQIIKNRWTEVELFSQIPDMLFKLKKDGYMLGILTSNTQIAVETVLQKAKVRELFSIIIAEPKLWGKAHRIKQFIHVHDLNPQRVWYVGDEVRDLEAAHEAQVKRVGVTWGLNTQVVLERTKSPVVNSAKELIHWIQTNSSNS